MTEWRVIPGFENYQASDAGDIRRLLSDHRKRHGTHKIVNGTVQKSNGYRYHNLYTDGVPKPYRTHRLIAITFLGEPPTPAHHVAHNDGNRLNNSTGNLRWATHIENEADKIIHGTIRKGENNHLSKLTEASVRHARTEFANGRKIRSIANEMGVTFQNIWCIVHRKTWAHVS